MVRAPQPLFLGNAILHGNTAVGTGFVDKSQVAGPVPVEYEVLAEEAQPHRRAVGFRQLPFVQRRDPVAPEQVAHGCPAAGLSQ